MRNFNFDANTHFQPFAATARNFDTKSRVGKALNAASEITSENYASKLPFDPTTHKWWIEWENFNTNTMCSCVKQTNTTNQLTRARVAKRATPTAAGEQNRDSTECQQLTMGNEVKARTTPLIRGSIRM